MLQFTQQKEIKQRFFAIISTLTKKKVLTLFTTKTTQCSFPTIMLNNMILKPIEEESPFQIGARFTHTNNLKKNIQI